MPKIIAYPVRFTMTVAAVAALVLAPITAQAASAATAPLPALPTASSQTVAEVSNPIWPSNDRAAQTFAAAGTVEVSIANTTHGISASSNAGTGFGIEIDPPAHQALRAGTYDLRNNGAGIPNAASLPSVQLFFPGGAAFSGHLDILDLASNAQGQFTRFDLVLEGIGELRMGENDNAPLTFGTRHVSFPEAAVGVAPDYSRETLQNTSGVAISLGSIRVSGRSASAFAISSNTCAKTLAAHAQCQFQIGFAPKGGGPQDAHVTVPVAGKTQVIDVAGSALLGTTKLVTTGADSLDEGKSHSYSSGPLVPSVSQRLDGWSWQWVNAYGVGANRATANFDAPAGAPLAVDTHTTGNLSPGNGTANYGANVGIESEGCLYTHGSETVKAFGLGANGLPTTANIAFTQYCEDGTKPMTGTLLWQSRTDITPPSKPTALKVSATSAAWTKSVSKDSTTTIARLVEGTGAGATPSSGFALFSGTGRTVTMPKLKAAEQYTVVLFSVDATGNISAPVTKAIATTVPVVMAPSAPTTVSAVAGDGSVTVNFTPPAKTGNAPITSYTVESLSGSQEVTGTSSPLTITGLKNGYGVRLVVHANNAAGAGENAYAPIVEPVPDVTASTPQLLSDPGFEQGDGGWTPYYNGNAVQPFATLSRVTSPVHGGTAALGVTASEDGVSWPVGIRNDAVVPHAVSDAQYTASCWIRPTSQIQATASLNDDTYTLYSTFWTLPAGVWTKVSVETKAVRVGTPMIPMINTSATPADGPVYFDDCSVTSYG